MLSQNHPANQIKPSTALDEPTVEKLNVYNQPTWVNNFFSHKLLAYFLVSCLGAITILGFAPFDYWLLPILSFSLFILINYLALEKQYNDEHKKKPINFFKLGFCFGFGQFLFGIYWIHISINTFSKTPWLISIIMTGGLICILAILVGITNSIIAKTSHEIWHKKQRPFSLFKFSLHFAAIWLGFELFRTHFLTGFPWLLLGYTATESFFASLAPFISVYGLSITLLVISGAIANLLLPLVTNRTNTTAGFFTIHFIGFSMVALLCVVANNMKFTEHHLPGKQISIVQGNIDQLNKWKPDHLEKTLNTYLSLTKQALMVEPQYKPDIVIWPEAAIPKFQDQAEEYFKAIEQVAEEENISVISGIPYKEEHPEKNIYYNSVITIGHAEGIYFKQKLVPFGEFIPLTKSLAEIGKKYNIPVLNLPIAYFTEGTKNQPPIKVGDLDIASYICWDIVYPKLVIDQADNIDMILTVSNDAWFGDSVAPHQHFQIAKMRAIETGRPIVRSTNTGVSGFIDHQGNTLDLLPQFEDGYLTQTISPTTGKTPITMIGLMPLYVFAFIYVCFVVLRKQFTFKKRQ